MKLIPLTQGFCAEVDDEDYDFLMQWKWCAHRNGYNLVYAIRSARRNGKKIFIRMHELILGKGCDHKDRNGLNNKRSNLREASHSDQMCNRKIPVTNTSGFKGVWWSKRKSLWVATIQRHKSRLFIGLFRDAPSAAKAYDQKALELHGEFAVLNFPI